MKSLNYGAVAIAVLMALSFFILWHEPLNPVGATDLFLSDNAIQIIAAGLFLACYSFVLWICRKDK